MVEALDLNPFQSLTKLDKKKKSWKIAKADVSVNCEKKSFRICFSVRKCYFFFVKAMFRNTFLNDK